MTAPPLRSLMALRLQGLWGSKRTPEKFPIVKSSRSSCRVLGLGLPQRCSGLLHIPRSLMPALRWV